MRYDKSFNKILLASLVCTAFVSYPNLLFLSLDWDFVPAGERACYIDNTLIRLRLWPTPSTRASRP